MSDLKEFKENIVCTILYLQYQITWPDIFERREKRLLPRFLVQGCAIRDIHHLSPILTIIEILDGTKPSAIALLIACNIEYSYV